MSQGHSPDALRWGSEAHYEDGAHYDQTYRRRKHDVAFYVEQAKAKGGPVLELGIGTGRVALALAREGIDVVGIEAMAPMIERLTARLAREPRAVRERIHVVRGDMRRFVIQHPWSTFPLVIAPFNVLMHAYTRKEIEGVLASVRAHLRPRGRFVFDVRMPDIRSFVRNPERAFRTPPVRDARGIEYQTAELFQYEARTQVQMITTSFRGPHPTDVFVKPLAHRQFFPQELEMLLHYNGLVLESMDGDFEGGVVHTDCESQVCVARLAKTAPARTPPREQGRHR